MVKELLVKALTKSMSNEHVMHHYLIIAFMNISIYFSMHSSTDCATLEVYYQVYIIDSLTAATLI